jgi:hypothetical protein
MRSVTSDSIKFQCDEIQADKAGEFVQETNCYAHPIKPHVCFILAIGHWISLNAEWLETVEELFLNKGAKPETTA